MHLEIFISMNNLFRVPCISGVSKWQFLVPMDTLYPSRSQCSTSRKSSQSHQIHPKAAERLKCSVAPSKMIYDYSGVDNKALKPVSGLEISGTNNLEDLILQLQGVAADCARLSPEACTGLEKAFPPTFLPSLDLRSLARLMLSIAAADGAMSQAWQDAALASIETHIAGCPSEDTAPLTELLWAACEMQLSPSTQWLATAEQAVARSVSDGSFLGPQLCTCLCALGELGSQPEKPWLEAISKEAEYQLAEFTSDFMPTDIARLAIGLSYLKAEISTGGNSPIMKAVYTKVRTIEEKGLVDWALAKLDSEEKSMVFDPRWNHEELSMLPNREKDKRRILSEGYYRTQWGGFRPGGK